SFMGHRMVWLTVWAIIADRNEFRQPGPRAVSELRVKGTEIRAGRPSDREAVRFWPLAICCFSCEGVRPQLPPERCEVVGRHRIVRVGGLVGPVFQVLQPGCEPPLAAGTACRHGGRLPGICIGSSSRERTGGRAY